MKSYVWLSFAFMGWAYYEVSGGDDFAPEQRLVAAVETPADGQPEAVTQTQAPTLLSMSTSNIDPVDAKPIVEATIETVALAVPADVVVETTALDIRAVAGTRVNMRMGPSTDYDVITTLTGGTDLEVLEVNADGWARISTVDRGIEGWMAERLLTDPQT